MSKSIDRLPQLGSKPVSLSVRLPQPKQLVELQLAAGLQDLYRHGEFVDVALLCAGRSYMAHRAVLASQSPVFRQALGGSIPKAPDTREEVRLADIHNPEAVKFMLDYFYGADSEIWEDYNPKSQEITKDVLRLAQQFEVPGITERATMWVAKDITTGNVVERLSICDEFGLTDLREKILSQLTMNKKALSEVANSQQIMKYPSLMQALLQQAAAVPDEPSPPPQPKKKARK